MGWWTSSARGAPTTDVPRGRPTARQAARRYCKKHAEDGMENVVSKRCDATGCTTGAAFRWPGQRPRFCGKHAEGGMVSGSTWSDMPEDERREEAAQRKELEAVVAVRVASQRNYISTARQRRGTSC